MLQAKFSIKESQNAFLNRYEYLGYKDKSAMLRTAIDLLRKKIEMEELKSSADMYSELYSEDDELAELTESALNGWPR